MRNLLQDLRFAVRSLAAKPAYTAAGALTMALGIGATTAIFSAVYAVLVNPLTYPDSGRLVRLHSTVQGTDIDSQNVAPADLADLEQSLDSLSAVGGFSYYGLALDRDGRPQEITTLMASAGLFEALRVQPAHGRLFSAEERSSDRVVLLGHAIWQEEFGGDAALVGETIQLEGEPWTVTGVLPRGFEIPTSGAQLVIPPGWSEEPTRERAYLVAVGRLAPGVTLAEAQEEADAVAAALAAEYPDSNGDRGLRLVPLKDSLVGGAQPTLFTLLAAVGLLLLIACANVTNLMLARGSQRATEIATRTALGASRRQIVRLMLAESTLLALLGAVPGLLLAAWGVDLLVAMAPADLPRAEEISVNLPVLGFSLLLVLVTGLVVGLLPALQMGGKKVASSLRSHGRRGADSRRSTRLRRLLSVAEVALSLVLLVGAGLMLKSFLRLTALDPGFNADDTLAVQLFVYGPKYAEPAQQRTFFDQLEAEVAALPGVAAVGSANALPLNVISYGELEIEVEGRAEPEPVGYGYRIATPGYFDAMERRLLTGRAFTADDRPDAQPVALLNQTAARRLFPGESPLGKRLRPVDGEDYATVVGVVGDARHDSLEVIPPPEVFFPFSQHTTGTMSLVARAEGDPAALLEAVQEKVWQVDPAQPVWRAFTFEGEVSSSTSRRRFYTTLVMLFASLAMLLAALGVYGMISYSVSQRTGEIALRMALGARAADILRMVLREGALLMAAGIGLGLALSLALTRLVTSLLFEVSATDPTTLWTVCLLLAALALVASLLPARRAAAVAPFEALRRD